MVKLTKDVKDATEITKNFNKSLKEKLPFADDVDFENAERGLVESTDDVVIKGEKGNEVWNLKQYDFERKDSPDTVNPSLWRQTQLNLYNGLYKVTDRIYQIRSYDLSNMTIIEGDTGLIIIDPLVSEETARAGLELYFKNRGKKAVVAVIHTHIHFDHYGGVKGVISQEDVDSGKVEVIAPERFMEEVVGENLFAQNAMMIRTGYYSGAFLDRSQYGQVDIGLGKAGSTGTSSIIPPTKFVGESGTKLTIDGIEIEFHMANDTEAPVEFMMYYPQFKVLNAAEVVTHHIHNVLTLRGAKVRDARKWWKAINDLVNIYADKSEILIAQHHWPTWGTENIKDLLIKQRDAYKYLHDQTVRRFNLGYNPTEIAEDLKLPSTLEKEWSLRDYYGSFNHDSKAIFQFYIGWYDGNPANLYTLPPEEAAKKYIEFMGGEDAVLEKTLKSFEKGEYRWVTEICKHLVFANPDNMDARYLEADALEQMAYQTENATWRNAFLSGAHELRNGTVPIILDSSDALFGMPNEALMEYLGLLLDCSKADGKDLSFNVNLTDRNVKYNLEISNAVLIYKEGTDSNSNFDLNMDLKTFLGTIFGKIDVEKIAANNAFFKGDKIKLKETLELFSPFPPSFNLVLP